MTGTRRLFLCIENQKRKTLKNGVPQGSVLAPTLSNIYLNDMPTTEVLKFGYADD